MKVDNHWALILGPRNSKWLNYSPYKSNMQAGPLASSLDFVWPSEEKFM